MTDFPQLPSPAFPPVIVGGGNAGLAAAARLSQRGIRAILLEKQEELGGQLRLSGGAFSGAGTRRQTAQGISDTAEDHRREVMRIGHDLATPYLVELATRHAATAIDWIDELGFPFEETTPAIVLGHEPYSAPRTYWGVHDLNGGRAILETLEPIIDPHIIDVRASHRLVEILTEDVGGRIHVTGLLVETPDGEQVISADTVVLATGGYAASRELLERLQPGRAGALLGCLDHATGDAHRILSELGVRIIGAEHYLPTMGMIENPEKPGIALRLTEARVIVDATARMPWEIWVNKLGERWVDETLTSPDARERALLEQPDLTWWSVWTEDVLTQASTTPIGPSWTADELRIEAQLDSWLLRADSVAELAARMGVSADALAKTLSEYNEGSDGTTRSFRPVRLETGPFYAVRSVGAMLLSRGGPEVDEALQPVTEEGITLHGIHAVGEVLGMSQFSGDAFAGGMSVGPALAFGVLVADRIADAVGRTAS